MVNERYLYMHGLLTAVEATMGRHLTKKCSHRHNHITNSSPCGLLSNTGHFIQELHRLDLWPLLQSFHDGSLELVSCQILKFENYKVSRACHTTNNSGKVYCDAQEVDFRDLLNDVVEESTKSQLGLCLDCVK